MLPSQTNLAYPTGAAVPVVGSYTAGPETVIVHDADSVLPPDVPEIGNVHGSNVLGVKYGLTAGPTYAAAAELERPVERDLDAADHLPTGDLGGHLALDDRHRGGAGPRRGEQCEHDDKNPQRYDSLQFGPPVPPEAAEAIALCAANPVRVLTPLGEIPDTLFRDMTMTEAHEYLLKQRRRPSRRTFLRGAAAATGAVIAAPTFWRQASAAGSTPEGLHVAFGHDPATEAVVAWSSPPGTTATLRYGPVGGPLDGTATVEERVVAGVTDRVYRRAALGQLDPGVTYAYDVNGATGTVTTATQQATGFRFAALGDMGASAAGLEITNRVIQAAPDLVFFVGDLCYADRLGGAAEPLYVTGALPGLQDLTTWDAWLAQIEPSARRTPWMFTPGNHEMEVGQGPLGYDGFLARMAVPNPYYSFRYQNVGFVALDANDVSHEITHNRGYTAGAQDAWLAATLVGLRADPAVDFIVVGFHHCMYCTNTVHGSDGGPRKRWGPLFDQHAVDLVVNGHNHSYERTHPVRAGKRATAGTVYVTAGAGGQAAYPSSLHPASYVVGLGGLRIPELAPWSAVRYLGDHSVLIVDAVPGSPGSPAQLRCEARAADADAAGNALVVDRFTLTA